MKKLLLVLAAAFAMVACQTDINEVGVVAGGEVDVTFEVGTPTRAYSDGTTATVLQYAVYEVVDKDNEGTAEILTPLTVTNGEIHGSTTVNLQLVTGNTYAVVFWAAAEGAPYTVDFGRTLDEATMTVNYDADKTFCNDEKRDAFFKKHVFTVKGAQTETIELRRPFAQLNIGTNDYTASAEAGYTPVKSYVEVAAYNTLKLATGVVENQATRVFHYAAINKDETFPVTAEASKPAYKYLAMNYLLVAADDETVDVKFGYTETDENAAKTRIVGSVPVKRNYRTNIYGQLLTSDVDINVVIKPEYEEDMHNGVVQVSNAVQFNAAFANSEVDFIVLTQDITLTTSATRSTNPKFTVSAGEELTIDLNGHRLIAETDELFDVQGTLIIKDGTIENTATDGKVLANNDDATLSNVTIIQSTDSAYFDEEGEKYELLAEGVFKVSDTEIAVTAPVGLDWVADQVDSGNTFEGKTVKLFNDIDLSDSNWNPIGDNRTDVAFTGVFDGNNKTITGAHITGDHCFNGAVYGSKEGWGLFSVLDGATVKNLKVDGATFGSYTVITGTIAAYANNTTFENIEITNTKIAGYNWYTGGVVGWAAGECTFKGINLDSTTAVGTLWDSHGQNAGGIAGGISSTSKITIEDCNIACVLDVINDITSNYKWCVYRVAGMIIGNTNTTETKYNEVVTATATNVTCNNVTVTYGDWMNYHYCEGFWNRGWGRYESSDYVGGVDENEPHNHAEGEQHYVCIPFDQLFGGSSNGSGHYPVKGLREFPGVTVNYPASYRREVSSVAALNDALGKGVSVILDADIDYGSTQLAITGENQVVDLGGHTLKTSMTHGGISLKNGASIVNGTIEHTSTVAAIKAFNVGSIENVTIKNTCATADKTVTGIAIQQGGYVGTIKDVTFEGVSQAIEVGYQATVDLIEKVNVYAKNNGTAEGIGLKINGGKVGKAKDCTFKGETYGVTLHLKGVFAAGLELENCKVEGTTASIYAWDEKGISNTSGSLVLTYDAATTLTGGQLVWDFEEECQSVVTLNCPQ